MIAAFEDDAGLSPNIRDGLELIEGITGQFEIVLLNNQDPHKHFEPLIEINEKYILGLIRFNTLGSQGYVITNQAMQHLLDAFPHFTLAVDRFLRAFWIHKLENYYIKPKLVFHGTDELKPSSYIEGHGMKSGVRVQTSSQKFRHLISVSIPKLVRYYRRTKFQ